MYNNMKTCCIIGNNPADLPWEYALKGKEFDNYLAKLSFEILKLIDNNYTYFISDITTSVDMDFAELILWLRDEKKLPIFLTCAITEANYMPSDRYQAVLGRADNTTYLTDTCTNKYTYMIDNSDIVVVIWNGVENGEIWIAINYAQTMGKLATIIRF